MRTIGIVALLMLAPLLLFGENNLLLASDDILIEPAEGDGFNLWVRKTEAIRSVLITESSADPEKRVHSYALRAAAYNDVNGDERRLLDGKFLDPAQKLYSLIDSTPEQHGYLGDAFRIYIPPTVTYGYAWSRAGEIAVGDGTFLNVRAFAKPYADYSGGFVDNPFVVRVSEIYREVSLAAEGPSDESPLGTLDSPHVTQERPVLDDFAVDEPGPAAVDGRMVSPVPLMPASLAAMVSPGRALPKPEETLIKPQPVEAPVEGAYSSEAVERLSEIASEGGGEAYLSPGKEDMVERIGTLIREQDGKTLDLVLALDTTRSMLDDMPYLQKLVVPILERETAGFERFRIGMLFYRDYMEEYLVKPLPFREDLEWIQRNINSVRVGGGRDVPEAVYEALYSGIHSYPWEADSRLIILIGDAPPHPQARGKITAETVYADAKELGIKINTIILPNSE